MKSIPAWPRDSWVIKMARAFIQRAGISWLPVKPSSIARQFGWRLLTVGRLARDTGLPRDQIINGQDSDVYWYEGSYAIVYNENAYRPRIPYTIAHEIGHIVLRHPEDFEQTRISRGGLANSAYWVLEREAELFAAELLMPLPILRALGAFDQDEIMKICNVSRSTAGIRSKELSQRFRMDNLKDDLWMQAQFSEYLTPVVVCVSPDVLPLTGITSRNSGVVILDRKRPFVPTDDEGRFLQCARCGNTSFSPDARYCKLCGLQLYNYCTEHEDDRLQGPCGMRNPGDARFCEQCGQETVLTRLGLLMTWEEVVKAHGDIAAALAPTPEPAQPPQAQEPGYDDNDVPF